MEEESSKSEKSNQNVKEKSKLKQIEPIEDDQEEEGRQIISSKENKLQFNTPQPGENQVEDLDLLNMNNIASRPKNEFKMKKYPYNGSSPFLISKIYVIGYEKTNLKKLIKKKEALRPKKPGVPYENDESLILDEKPSVLNMFTSESIETIPALALIDLLYLDLPQIYDIETTSSSDLKPQNIFFSVNTPIDSTTQSSLHYHGYLYYRKSSVRGKKWSCPRALCFVTYYPFLLNYITLSEYYAEKLASKYLNELWLYHLVNLPAPINSPYQLFYFPSSEINIVKPMLFSQLSGIPLLQFKVPELFNILPVEMIISIFLFTFLEIDMLFFSKTFEVLNIVMSTFASLNYPLNDSSYYSNIVSVSLDTFKQGKDPSVTKTHATMLGVNASYDKSIEDMTKKLSFFVIDIDDKEVYYSAKDTENSYYDDTSIMTLLQMIRTISRNKAVRQSVLDAAPYNFIQKTIAELYNELQALGYLITRENISRHKLEVDFFKIEPNLNFDSHTVTRSIQERFYSFIITMLSQYQVHLTLSLPSQSSNSFSIHLNESNDTVKGEGIAEFSKLFKQCSKYTTYFSSFMRHNSASKLYRIPLSFLQEFIHQSISNLILGKGQAGVLKVIDYYYNLNYEYGLTLNMENYFNSMVSLSSHKSLDKNYIYEKELCEYIKEILVTRKTKKKKSTKIKSSELFYYFYYHRNHIARDPLRILSRFNSKCDHIGKLLDSPKPPSNVSTVFMNVMTSIIREIEKKKGKCVMNRVALGCLAEIHNALCEKLTQDGQTHFYDVVYCCFMLLFIIGKSFEFKESPKQFKLVVKLIKRHKYIYSSRKYLSSMIILLIEIMKEKRLTGQDYADEHKHLVRLILLFKELNFIPNEELMLYLNDACKSGLVTIEDMSFVDDKEDNEQDEKENALEEGKDGVKMFLQYNFFNSHIIYEEFFVRLAMNSIYNGNLYINVEQIDGVDQEPNQKDLKLCWNVVYKKKKYSTPLFSPLKLFNLLNEKYCHIAKNGYERFVPSDKELINICFMVVFYLKYGNAEYFFNEQIGYNKDLQQKYIKLIYDILDKLLMWTELNKE